MYTLHDMLGMFSFFFCFVPLLSALPNLAMKCKSSAQSFLSVFISSSLSFWEKKRHCVHILYSLMKKTLEPFFVTSNILCAVFENRQDILANFLFSACFSSSLVPCLTVCFKWEVELYPLKSQLTHTIFVCLYFFLYQVYVCIICSLED